MLEQIALKLATAVTIAVISWLIGNMKGWMQGEAERQQLDDALTFALEYYR